MNIRPNQKTTKLRTRDKTFQVHDYRGVRRFPQDQGGFVFEYFERREIQDKFTGLPIKRNERYVIRTDNTGKGWRIDRFLKVGPDEAIYGLDGASYWRTNTAAAQALSDLLDEIRDNSSSVRVSRAIT